MNKYTMNGLEERSENSKPKYPKIIRDENGRIIKTTEGILCEYTDNDGNTTLKFMRTGSSYSKSPSTIEAEDIMPCNTVVTQENNCKNVEKFVIAHDYLFSSSDSSNEEFQYIYHLMQNRKKKMKHYIRRKHYIRDVIDRYTEEDVIYPWLF